MPERRDLTEGEWALVRARWEGAHAPSDQGWRWLVLEIREALNAEIAPKIIERRALADGWCKRPDQTSSPLTPKAKRDKGGRHPFSKDGEEPPTTDIHPVVLPEGVKPSGYAGRGRPTDYRPEYAGMLDEFFRRFQLAILAERTMTGTRAVTIPILMPTIGRFAALIGVWPQRISEWVDRHPEFAEAHARALGVTEALLVEGGLAGHFNPQVVNFALRNLCGWKDRKDEAPTAGQVNAAMLDELYGSAMAKSREDGRRLREQRAKLRAEMDRPTPTREPAAEQRPAGGVPEEEED
ncbi:MAG: hypothetical protein KIT17_00630 [Rubrivivax sp.]|nr:hypothetical protein [Rubrivivax sp.]